MYENKFARVKQMKSIFDKNEDVCLPKIGFILWNFMYSSVAFCHFTLMVWGLLPKKKEEHILALILTIIPVASVNTSYINQNKANTFGNEPRFMHSNLPLESKEPWVIPAVNILPAMNMAM